METTVEASRKPYKATWEEYEALGEIPHSPEYIDGWIVMAPNPTIGHQHLSLTLATALDRVLPEGYRVALACNLKLGGNNFIPDVMVYRTTDLDSPLYLTKPPVLCVEILSSNWANDMVTKMKKYAECGIPRYWVIDPNQPVLNAYVLDGAAYRLDKMVTADEMPTVSFGVGSLQIDLAGWTS